MGTRTGRAAVLRHAAGRGALAGVAGARPLPSNRAMDRGTGALPGALRGVWAAVGLRGRRAHLAHTVTRLCFDRTVENGTGVGAPPRSWPPSEELVDVAHEAVCSPVTGLLTERWIRPELESWRGRTSR